VTAVAERGGAGRTLVAWRIAWTVLSLIAVQSLVCGLAVAPVVLFWRWLDVVSSGSGAWRWALFSVAIAPSYVAFALALLLLSPLAMRILRWHTPPDAEMRIPACGWPVLRWARYCASLHVCRLVGGMLVRGTPVWTTHLRLCGARLGKRVYVNSLAVSDYNLLEGGDDVVIGDAVHLSGHTVENGVVKTARVTLGSNVTIGLGSVIEIGAVVGSNVQIGALSFVPKYAHLEGNAIYAGVPVKRLEGHAPARVRGTQPAAS
jgi:acetyltransferase-like isoleucine patch superfamily enzyme